MMIKKIPLANLIEDFSLYPRNTVNDTHISDLVRALESGEALPPIVVEAKTMRIVDGVHRSRCYRKVLGDAASVDCDVRSYETTGDMFIDAVSLNAGHGRKLDAHDRTRIVLRCRELKIPDKVIALKLHVPERQLKTISMRVVKGPAGEDRPYKRGFAHLAGKRLTASQIQVLDVVQSGEVSRKCRELIGILEEDMYNHDDVVMLELLRKLRDTIATVINGEQSQAG